MSRRKPYEFEAPKEGAPILWQSLEDKNMDAEERRKRADVEIEPGVVEASALVGRRGFLTLSSVAAASVALEGCIRRPVENILPYSHAPEHLVPGVPMHFATVTSRDGDALGVLVTSHEGRPTKVEGNPEHPSSLGGTDLRAQATLMDLYDPDRAKEPHERAGEGGHEARTMTAFDDAYRALVASHEADLGAGLRFLARPTNSPSFVRLRESILRRFPRAKFYTYAPVNDRNLHEGGRIAFGQRTVPLVEFMRARVVLSIDSDFLGTETGSVRAARGFALGRAIEEPSQTMNRLYVVESGYSITGASADHRLRLAASDVEGYLRALARTLVEANVDLGPVGEAVRGASTEGFDPLWLSAVATELNTSRGTSVIVVGRRQPPAVHALANAINVALSNVGQTVRIFPPVDPQEGAHIEDLKALAAEMGSVRSLVILDGNPVLDAPSDLRFADLLKDRDGLTAIHLTSHVNETSELCTWAAPLAHELEAWGDQRAIDGTISIQQPLIAPLWQARSAIELLSMAAGEPNWRGHYVVRATLRAMMPTTMSFERDWRRALHRGVVVGSATRGVDQPLLDGASVATALRTPGASIAEGTFEAVFVPHATLHDGRHANNLWALELPDPMTKIVWDNAALISRATRDALGVRDGQMVKLTREGAREISVPVFTLPGHADRSITLLLGWGRTAAGRYGNGRGFDVYPFRTSDGFDIATGVRVEKTSEHYEIVQLQTHAYMEERPIAIGMTVAEYRERPNDPSFRTVEMSSTPPLWREVDYTQGHRWGMTIDLSTCTGCNACVLACQSENNIPVVGKYEVKRGRNMQWLRIDRYFIGANEDNPPVAVQPVACQQCEEAPCENVCPVNATAHSPEGLNDMAYNRCIGTRYCANNCPYKVRRFNYLDWHTHIDDHGDRYLAGVSPPTAMHGAFPEVRKMQFNPNVTVRMRGVMEKCTYCVQRIESAKIVARREQRAVRDGDIVTACQQACPSGAIAFGDLNDAASRVSRIAALNRGYKLLAEIGTQPRTTFLAKIRNPNPAFEAAEQRRAETQEAHG